MLVKKHIDSRGAYPWNRSLNVNVEKLFQTAANVREQVLVARQLLYGFKASGDNIFVRAGLEECRPNQSTPLRGQRIVQEPEERRRCPLGMADVLQELQGSDRRPVKPHRIRGLTVLDV